MEMARLTVGKLTVPILVMCHTHDPQSCLHIGVEALNGETRDFLTPQK